MGKFEKTMDENKPKREGKIKTSKIVKLGGAVLLVGTIAVAGISIYDSTVNHIEEKCPLCSVVGLQHQADVINDRHQDEGYYAYYQVADPDTRRAVDMVDAVVTKNEDGTYSYTIPTGYEGYELVGNKCVKYVDIAEVKSQVIVVKHDGVICEDGSCELVTTEVNRFTVGEEQPIETVESTTPTR